MKPRPYNPEFVASPFGLNNTGAICWFNAVTQFLLGVPAMSSVILEHRDELVHNELAAEYIRALDGLLPNTPDMEPITPANFAGMSSRLLDAMLKSGEPSQQAPSQQIPRGKSTLGYGQQCASEGFTTFLETLTSTDVDNIFMNAYRQVITCKRCNEEVSTMRDTSNMINVPPTKNFANDEEQSRWRAYTAELSYSHPHRSVIKNFRTQAEFQKWLRCHSAITEDFCCPKCNYKMPFVLREERLSMVQDVLTISFDMIDRIDPTWYPQELEFPGNNGVTRKYKLCGKICWSGSVNRLGDGRIASGGHYWAHSLRDGNWYCLNDGGVSAGNPHPDSSTFMVVYHLV